MRAKAIVCAAAGAASIGVLALLLHRPFSAAQVQPKPTEELAALINAYRGTHQFCEGRTMPPAGPLAPDAVLAGIALAPGADLQALLHRAGYRAARAQAIVVSGPRDSAAAMAILRSKYCQSLLDPQFAQIGVSLESATWRVVLAMPLLSADLGDWRAAGKEVLQLTNEARAVARTCGSRHFPAAPPLAWDAQLAAAALAHSEDMAKRKHLSHAGRDGSRVQARAERAGYEWRGIGENVATGQGSAARVVAGWLASPTHCANLMNSAFTQMGAAYAIEPSADTVIYWTQVLGTPR